MSFVCSKSAERALDFSLGCAFDSGRGGIAAYRTLLGKSSAYPETTGYFIPTLLRFSSEYPEKSLSDVASNCGSWLLDIQLDDGSFNAGTYPQDKYFPSVFNTGQIVFGLLAIVQRTGDDRYKFAISRACDWLCSVQDNDGIWRKHTYNDSIHVYNVRVGWALELAGKFLKREDYRLAAEKAGLATLRYQNVEGWFDSCGFRTNSNPFLHTFAYTTQGLLEIGSSQDNDQFIDGAFLASRKLAEYFKIRGSLPGYVSSTFGMSGFKCLTGMAQQAIVFQRLAHLKCLPDYGIAALQILEYLDKNQTVLNRSLTGGFGGSKPFWAPYMRFRYPQWASKFYLDLAFACETQGRDLVEG